ncbi:hypothetical protein QM816_00240 [Streptococcus oralis]|uniref:hypothetical protein n=1 Tax=Streptococcus oralis TaxID=1303 RepID=UPI0020528ACD|nr:MAG TPA: hypothetical protein [Caudoviricetes sp.]
MSNKEASPVSLENLKNDIQRFVEKVADEAIQQSETYSQAILLVSKNTSFSEHGLAMAKAIQDEITKRALNSRTKNEPISIQIDSEEFMHLSYEAIHDISQATL